MVRLKKPNFIKKLTQVKDDLLQPIKKNLILKKRISNEEVLDLKCDVKIISNVVRLKNCDIKLIKDPIDPNPTITEVEMETPSIQRINPNEIPSSTLQNALNNSSNNNETNENKESD